MVGQGRYHGRKPNPGQQMYIDWVGDKPELLTDTETGEIKGPYLCRLRLESVMMTMQKLFQMRSSHVYR